MDSAIRRLEKQVGETNRKIDVLNERFGGLERTVKEFMMETKGAFAQREERGKSPLVRSLNKDKLSILERLEQFNLTGSFGNRSKPEIPSMPKSVPKPKESGGTSRKKGGIKKMTEAEFQFRMMKCLCFLCEELYSVNHECKNKHLQLLLADDVDDLFDEDETDEGDELKTAAGEIQDAFSKKSTVADKSGAFKFLGKIGSREVVVKIGSGASHNFISEELVADLQMPLERTKSFRVNFGGCFKHKGTGVCKNVVVKAQGVEIVGRFFPTKLGTADVMLGLEWLKSLGIVYYEFEGSPLSMSFVWHGRKVTLQSDPSLTNGMEIGIMTLEWDDEED